MLWPLALATAPLRPPNMGRCDGADVSKAIYCGIWGAWSLPVINISRALVQAWLALRASAQCAPRVDLHPTANTDDIRRARRLAGQSPRGAGAGGGCAEQSGRLGGGAGRGRILPASAQSGSRQEESS